MSIALNYIQDETYGELNQQVNEVKRMLNSVIKKLTANGWKLTAQVETLCSYHQNIEAASSYDQIRIWDTPLKNRAVS